MDPIARIAREARFLDGLARTLWRVRKIDPESNVLICDDFEDAVDRFADHTAITFEGETTTYRQLEAIANRFAAWAESAGVKRGDTVALHLPNRTEYVAAWMGLAKRGVASALINTNLQGAALAHSLSISGADHAITDATCLPAFDTMRVQLARPLTLWVLDAPADLSEGRRALTLKGAATRPDRSIRAGLKSKDVALYIYTSGTTGMPKAAKITHSRAQLYMRAFAGATKTNTEDRLYCALPLYHSTGGLCGVGAALLNGGTLVLRRKFSATHFWSDIVDQECTIFVYIGELCRYLVNQPPNPLERAHKLKTAFGNGLRPEVWAEFQERFGVQRILEFYGSTEGNVSLFNFDGQPGAVGRVPHYLKKKFPVALAKFDVEAEQPVRNAEGLCIECAVGEIGEAIGRIKNDDARSSYTGYADKAASERKILHDAFEKGDAWFRTGDLMRQDKAGYFYFVDRIGDTFRWKGENVSTTEVQESVARYPGVLEANVYGVGLTGIDGRAGMVAITPAPDFDLAGLRQYLANELPSYARPIFIRIEPAIETTGTFKYRKMDLVREGFDPAQTAHALYFDHPTLKTYAPITPALYAEIQGGAFKL
ncbi:MAG: long-chain-acyl-CoA synthetase [Terricaulis sp.]